jgi:hypothetical protein
MANPNYEAKNTTAKKNSRRKIRGTTKKRNCKSQNASCDLRKRDQTGRTARRAEKKTKSEKRCKTALKLNTKSFVKETDAQMKAAATYQQQRRLERSTTRLGKRTRNRL